MKKSVKKIICFCIALAIVSPSHLHCAQDKKITITSANSITKQDPIEKPDKSIKNTPQTSSRKNRKHRKKSNKIKNKPEESKNQSAKKNKQQPTQQQLYIDETENFYFKAECNNVVLKTKTYATKSECQKILGNNGQHLLAMRKKAIYPIEITVTNNGNKTWTLTKKDIKLKTVPKRRVIKRILHRTKLRAFFAGIGMFLGAIIVCTLAMPFIPTTLLPILGIPDVLCGILLTPMVTYVPIVAQPIVMTIGTVTGASTFVAAPFVSAARAETMERINNKLRKQISDMTKYKTITIKPGETKSLFLFVRHRMYKKRFSVPLINTENKEEKLIFDVACQPV